MKNSVRIFILLLLPLLLAAILFIVTTFLSPIIHQNLVKKLFSANLFIHLLFNFILIAIILKECYTHSSNKHDTKSLEDHGEKTSFDEQDLDNVDMEGGDSHRKRDDYNEDDEDDDDYYYDHGSDGYEEDDEDDDDYYYDHGSDGYDEDDEDDDDYYYDHGSDGYDEDDDDDGSYGEIGWEEEDEEDEEYDSELERRIEAFIAKVINGWKEEWFSDNLNI